MSQLSVIIVTTEQDKRVTRLMEDLSQQTYKDFEVVLVDASPEGNISDVVKAYQASIPEMSIHKAPESNHAICRNVGAENASYERLLFLSAEAKLPANFLSEACAQLEKKHLDIAGVYVGNEGSGLAEKGASLCFNAGLFMTQYLFPSITNVCLFSTQTVHERIGGFDENIIRYRTNDYIKRASNTWRFRLLSLSLERHIDKEEIKASIKSGFQFYKDTVKRAVCGEFKKSA
ncbi:glycosyltransferase [Vibrio caribbeanicus]|uniref:glycosyltransferase n=1 Tax=Vibrio caribbeanicus TaxID=701175 RepID=UPI0030D82F54